VIIFVKLEIFEKTEVIPVKLYKRFTLLAKTYFASNEDCSIHRSQSGGSGETLATTLTPLSPLLTWRKPAGKAPPGR
jgi:hypothetical protein